MADDSHQSAPDRRRDEPLPPGQPDEKGSARQKPEGPVHLKGPRSLERLRDRIQAAASEIVRLREENAALATRLAGMASQLDREESSPIRLDEDPEALRRKVSGFIEAIDRYLDSDVSK